MNDDELFEDVVRDLANPLDWRTVPAYETEQRWNELRDWVGWFKDRYALDHRVVPPCWYLHGALVDLVSALCDHHRVNFDRLASPSGATEWHIAFRNVEPRLREWAARTGCTRELHRPDVDIDWPDDAERWSNHVAADKHEREMRELAHPLDEHTS
jgi:hypothetical protein